MPIAQTSVPVQFEDVFQAFDPKTRTAIDKNLVGFGDTFAARGSALNDTFASLPKLSMLPAAGGAVSLGSEHGVDAVSGFA